MSYNMILHVRSVTGCGGGPEKTILNSPRFLTKLGYRSACAYLRPPRDAMFQSLRQRASASGARLIEVDDRGALDYSLVKRLIRTCREEQVAVWHGHDYKSNALGLLVRRFWPMTLVTTVHGWVEHTRRTPLYYKIDKLCLPRYDEVICVSSDLHAECLRVGVSPSRCHLIHNAIDVEEFRRSRTSADARKLFSEAPANAIIGAMGRLSEEKGFDILIRSVHRLIKSGHDASLWIAGEGPARRSLQSLVNDLGVAEKVRLLGHVEDIKSFFEAIDLFALSSLREGLPNVLLEAMAMEIPIVATRIAGVPSLVADGQNGLLVDPNDVRKLADCLQRLLLDNRLQDSLRTAARTTIENGFNFQQRMQKVVDIYDRLLGRSLEIGKSLACGV